MVIYNFVVGELGLGDSRVMSTLADTVSKVIFFGGFGWIIFKLVHFQLLLNDKGRMQQEFYARIDERREIIYNKCGGIRMDILLYILLFITCTAALVNETAFRVSLLILVITLAVKAIGYIIFSRKY